MKIYTKGTKITLYSSCTFAGTDQSDTVELEKDMTEKEVSELAENFMWESLQPEYWFKVAGKEEKK